MDGTKPQPAILDHRAAGFSLLELLVVLTVIGVLIGLLLPAVQAAREAARQLQCRNNVKQLALAAVSHESSFKFFPTGGWNMYWLGNPDRGFGKRQPGGWIYNILPFIEQQALHDLGASGGTIAIQDANAIRCATPLDGLNCPSRRPATLCRLAYPLQFHLTAGSVGQLARSDYAMNAGDYVQWCRQGADYQEPTSLQEGDDPKFRWDDMSLQTGICHQRSQVTLADVKDGTSSTFLIGEKYINRDHYTDGKDLGDSETMYGADQLDLLRWTGVAGTAGTVADNNLPMQDRSHVLEGNKVQWFGSPHAAAFNASFCDGSTRAISYSIDGEVYRRLGNRKDGLPLDGSRF
jgi:prepilin-type N-terminal cleavage/methylation domain-containing protein